MAGELGGLNILVNNAGITIGEQFVADMVLADWRRVLDANLNSVLYMCEVAAACGVASGQLRNEAAHKHPGGGRTESYQ